MNKLILFLMTMASVSVLAYPCPKAIETDPQTIGAKRWLERFQGQHQMRGCQVEITVCNEQEPHVVGGPLAEVYILDEAGREAYLPLVPVAEDTPRMQASMQIHRRSLYYLKKDSFHEPELGRTEVYRLELKTEWDNLDKFNHVSLGTYSTNRRLRHRNGNESRWYNCGES
ncbi:MAG: hypothetical protein KF799_13470 [Bdellovibrionales bacterium]|nr:hypothetical protein [Bdellovibrionales bacterium]